MNDTRLREFESIKSDIVERLGQNSGSFTHERGCVRKNATRFSYDRFFPSKQ